MTGFAAEALIDLTAIESNVRVLRERAPNSELMAVVKGDGYGHGLLPSARAALRGGAHRLGVAQPAEALELRRAGITAPLLAWLFTPATDLTPVLAEDVELSVAAPWSLDGVLRACRALGRTARIHLKVDTGLARGGAYGQDWDELVKLVAAAQAEQAVEVVGIWSHMVYADAPEHPTVTAQQQLFAEALVTAERAGVRPALRHLSNSAATLVVPSSHLDLVRPGLAVYGLSPVPDVGTAADFGLRPAMRLQVPVAGVKNVPAGQGVSYAHTYTTSKPTTLALLPLGYADGVPRHASGHGPVQLAGRRLQVAGRVCMDQIVVDLGDRTADVKEGDLAVLFGAGTDGEPTAQDWAQAADTISYEIVTRVGPRVPRRYLGEQEG